jgi:putative AdoMet-dependent methyltransferase
MTHELYPASDFDHWASSYDQDVQTGDFPFAGYLQALDTVVKVAEAVPAMQVLDVGTGTGNLAVKFAALGCNLWCTDFSAVMLEQARLKLPQARFALHDLRQDKWPDGFDVEFDRIVSAYVFHHFDLREKIHILQTLSKRLTPDGRLVIADIAFPTQGALQAARQMLADAWEEEEYWLTDESLAALRQAGFSALFTPVSWCAGVFCIKREQ